MNPGSQTYLPLTGVRVLDFSRVLAGPYATRLLADFGAEIIKVQPPHPEETDAFARGYYETWNRNKLGIALDLALPAGREIARRLAAVCDAVVENFTPRVMSNWGLDYDIMKTIKPDIIMLSMSALGRTGPWRDYAAFGPTIHAFSGLTCLTSYPSHPPCGPGFAYADHVAGLFGVLALLGALDRRRRTGQGQHIDISQVETMTSFLGSLFVDYTLNTGGLPPGSEHPGPARHGVYGCRGDDRWCAISVSNDTEWAGLKRAMSSPGWAEDSRFGSPAVRLENAAALDKLIESWTAEHSAEEVMATLQANGVAAGVVQNARDLACDLQLRARGFLAKPVSGEPQNFYDASPIRMSGTSPAPEHPAPGRGRDSDRILRELLAMNDGQIAELRRQGVVL